MRAVQCFDKIQTYTKFVSGVEPAGSRLGKVILTRTQRTKYCHLHFNYVLFRKKHEDKNFFQSCGRKRRDGS